ncbi:MAG: oligoendopeptidase F, partial [Paraclostridium sp.]
MGKNMYRVITIVIAVILFASILLKRDINGNSEALSEKALEMINDTSKKEPSKNDKKEEEKKPTKFTTWDISKLYKSNNDWKKNLSKFSKETKELENYVGKVTKSQKHLLYALNIKEELDSKLEKLSAYVSLNSDINNKSYDYLNMNESLNKVYKEYSFICSNLELEILKLSNKDFKDIMKNEKISSKYSMYLNDIRRNKKHYLNSKEEEMLSNISDIASLPKEVYDLFMNMDKKSNLNPSQYSLALESSNREERKKAYENESLQYN